MPKELMMANKPKGLKTYSYPMMCKTRGCPSPAEFHVISHTHIGSPANFLPDYCPFCGQKSLVCRKCHKPNYECGC